MNVNQLQQIILSNTFTKADYLKRVRLMRAYLEQQFFTSEKMSFADFLAKLKISQRDREAILPYSQEMFKFFTYDNTYLLIDGLLASMKSLPLLTLYLAVILDDYQIDDLGKWFRQNLNPELLMEVHCNPALVSGCAFVWNGKYRDLSLHNFISKKQELITSIIQAYAAEKFQTAN